MTNQFFRIISTVCLLAVLFTSCGPSKQVKPLDKKQSNLQHQTVDTPLFTIIPFDTSQDGIFDKSYSPATLTKSEIVEIEALLYNCVTDYNSKLSSEDKKDYGIDLTNKSFKRQFVAALNTNGDKEVWINCFCHTSNVDWRTGIIMVLDGGNCFFNLKVNLTKGKCYDLSVNGYA